MRHLVENSSMNDTGSESSETADLSDFSAEAQLVLQATRGTAKSREQLHSLVSSPLNWSTVLEFARMHGVTQIVFDTLSTYCKDEVPEETFNTMRSNSQRINKTNLQFTQELIKIMALFEAADIDCIPYRGPVLATEAYGDLGHRQFSDLDLLVRRSDIPNARKILMEHGYNRQYERSSTTHLSRGQEYAYTLFRRDYPFYNVESKSMVELHWRVLDRRFPTAIQLDTVWDRRKSIEIAGQTIPALSPEDRLLMLCVHGSRHYWERLEWICDVVMLIQSTDIDWKATLDRATEFGAKRMFLLGPKLAADLYGVTLPDHIEERIEQDERIDRPTQIVTERLFASDRSTDQLQLQWFQGQTLDCRRDVIKLAVQWLFTPTRAEIERFSVPQQAAFLYVLYRPVHLLLLVCLRAAGVQTQ